MTKVEAVRLIYNILNYLDADGGLPRAVNIYNYLTGYGDIKVTEQTIRRYFGV